MSSSPPIRAAEQQDQSLFSLYTVPWRKVDYHLLSVEGLARLSPENPGLATRTIRGLGRLGPVGWEDDGDDKVFALHARTLAERSGSAETTFIVGEWLGELLNDEIPPFIRDTPSFARFGEASVSLLERAHQQAIEDGIPQKESSSRDYSATPIAQLEMGVRAHRLLRDRGINDLGTLAQQSRKRLDLIPGWGPVSMREAERELFRLGLSLAPEDDEAALDRNPPSPGG